MQPCRLKIVWDVELIWHPQLIPFYTILILVLYQTIIFLRGSVGELWINRLIWAGVRRKYSTVHVIKPTLRSISDRSSSEFGVWTVVSNITSTVGEKPVGISGGMKRLFVVVLTGGPCGGKSSSLRSVRDTLRGKGYHVMTMPEVPTILMSNGANFPGIWHEQESCGTYSTTNSWTMEILIYSAWELTLSLLFILAYFVSVSFLIRDWWPTSKASPVRDPSN